MFLPGTICSRVVSLSHSHTRFSLARVHCSDEPGLDTQSADSLPASLHLGAALLGHVNRADLLRPSCLVFCWLNADTDMEWGHLGFSQELADQQKRRTWVPNTFSCHMDHLWHFYMSKITHLILLSHCLLSVFLTAALPTSERASNFLNSHRRRQPGHSAHP